MARGQAQVADTQLKKTNAVGDTQQGKADTLESQLVPGYTSLMNTGYLSPEEEAAATTSEMGAATQPFESAGFKAANRASATGNASDLTAEEDKLALEEGQTAGGAAAELQKEKMNNQLAGMYGLGGQEAGNRGEAMSMYGLGPGTLHARAAGGPSPWWGIANTLLSNAKGAGGPLSGGT